jgi:hypothetical protein
MVTGMAHELQFYRPVFNRTSAKLSLQDIPRVYHRLRLDGDFGEPTIHVHQSSIAIHATRLLAGSHL